MRRSRALVVGFLVLVLLFGVGGAQPSPGSGGPAFSLGEVRGWLRDSLGVDALPGWPGLPGSDGPVSVESTAELVLPRDEPALAAVEWPEPERVGELTGRRTANGRFFELSDGRVQAEISTAPVHYRDAEGVFRPIDTTVGEVSRPGFVKGNETNTFTSLFGDRTDRLVRFEVDGRHVELGLADPARRVEPVVDGPTVTYPGVAGGADLVYTVGPRELREEIVLARPPAGGEFSVRFTVDTGGVEAVPRGDGSVGFVPASGGEPVFVIPAPYLYDSAADPGSPIGQGYRDPVTQTVTRQGSTAVITVTADAGWLADPARVYPVTVDPTIRIQPVPTDAADVEIYSGDPTRNYNDTYQLKVGTDATDAWRTLVQFPLTGVPAGTQLDDAQLELFYDQTHFTWEHDVPLLVNRVTAPWDESTATWANMASNFGAQPAGNRVTVDDGSASTSVVGSWPFSSNPDLTPLAVGDDYRFNSGAATGDTHTWVPTITEPGNYQVQVHFVSASDRPSSAPYTVFYDGGQQTYQVDQSGVGQGVWKTLGTHPFKAGTAGRVVLGDVANRAAIADAVRLVKWGAATKKRAISSVWTSFPVRNVVQDWVNGTQDNHGFMVRAQVESTKGRGGPVYEASEFAYQNNRRDYNLPKLVVTFGRPGTSVDPPTLVTATGAALSWPAYEDPTGPDGGPDDIVEYQVHRSVFQTYVPSAATLVAPVAKPRLSYQDTSATPTPTNENDPLKQNFFYYMVAVKTADGQVIAGPTQGVQLPKAGQITRIFRETSAGQVPDTTLSQAQPNANVNVYDGDPYVSPGNNSPLYGDARGLVRFDNLAGIPADAKVVDAQLRMWNVGLIPGTDTDEFVDVYRVTRDWNETSATWNQARPGVAWNSPGGDFATPALAGFNGFTNDPEWEVWDVRAAVNTWLDDPSSNHGLLLRQRDEVNQTARALLLSSEGAEPLVRPTLQVTYLQQDPVSTYHAPETPATRMIPGDDYTIPVTVSNPTPVTLPALEWELSYRWQLPDGTDATTGGNQLATPLPADIPSGGAVDVPAALRTPIQSDEGNKRSEYVLRWELRNKLTGQWLSEVHGIGSLDQHVVVEDPTSDQLGLEKFYQYAGVNTGAGQAAMVNTHAGNLTLGYNAFANPGRGLATHVRMVYNSQDTSASAMGFGWSMAGSTITRLGSPLEFHPKGQDWPTDVTLVDGDGTSHFFTLDKHGSTDPADWEYASPAGVYLLLQRNHAAGDPTRAWVMTKPDRTQFYFDEDGYPSAVVDRNGNTQTFTHEERRSQNKPVKFLQYVTDPAGRQTLTLEYYQKGEDYQFVDDSGQLVSDTNLTNPHIIDQLRSVTDVDGRRIELFYTDKGLMARLVDGAGTPKAKTFRYAYDALQGNRNVKLVGVTDPRGNTTDLSYYDPPPEPKFHWWAESITARDGGTTGFAYVDPDGQAGSVIETTVTDPETNPMVYVTDGFGRPTSVTDALAQTTSLAWDADNNVVELTEANGAVTSWTYDQDTGYPLTITDPEANANGTPATVLTYQTELGGHVAELASKTSPQGRAWTFGYDLVGNLTEVTDPASFSTSYEYDTFGRLVRAIDANQQPTVFTDYHDTGFPELIVDPLGGQVETSYDARGNVLSVVDEVDATTTVDYDVFNRPGEMVQSLDAGAGEFITTPAPVYDPNDNVTVATAPNGGAMLTAYDPADRPVQFTLPEDNPGGPARVATVSYDLVGNVLSETEPLGSLTPADPADHVTSYGYDQVYQLISVTDAEGNQTVNDYDTVGNLIETVDARGNPTGYAYDRNHRLTTVTDAAGHTTRTEYDLDSLVTATIDQEGVRTETVYDQRSMVSEVRSPHRPGSTRITRYEYDPVGNPVRVTSPRGAATTEPDDFVQQTVYDELNRPVEQILPFDPGDPEHDSPDRIFYEYDEAGRVTMVSAPPSAGQTVRNNTHTSYLDTGWVETTTDPWGIVTAYDYNVLGQQTGRTLTSAGGSSGRTMTWEYFPDGKLAARSDDGVPVGLHEVLVDNSDAQNVSFTGTLGHRRHRRGAVRVRLRHQRGRHRAGHCRVGPAHPSRRVVRGVRPLAAGGRRGNGCHLHRDPRRRQQPGGRGPDPAGG